LPMSKMRDRWRDDVERVAGRHAASAMELKTPRVVPPRISGLASFVSRRKNGEFHKTAACMVGINADVVLAERAGGRGTATLTFDTMRGVCQRRGISKTESALP